MSFITGLLGSWKTAVAALAIGLTLGAGGAWRVMSWKEGAAVTQQAKATVRLVVRQSDITMNIGGIVLKMDSVAQQHTATVTQEIPAHVTPQIDTDYPVPLGFVRVFNDASHGAIPPSSAGADADPSGVPLSDVARAHTDDEGTLDICRAHLTGWQDWYSQQSAAWNKATQWK